MYYVYKVEIPSHKAVYVGCTNNIRRRKDQHNGNASTGKSLFGRFLKSAGIRLNASDMQIIEEYEDRHEALVREREEVKKLNGTGIVVLNDNYSDNCSRKGLKGDSNPCARKYVLIDMESGTFEFVSNVHKWSDEHGTAYKTLIGTANRKPLVHAGRYIMRHVEEWNEMSDDERECLVNGEWYASRLRESKEHRISVMSKTYIVETPEGETVTVKNLDMFAREHGINAGNLHASRTTGKSACGYRVVMKVS